jgi:hypothetical protein
VSGSYSDLPEELRSDLEELLRAGPPLTEEQQIGRGPAIEDLAERLRRSEVKKLYEARRVGKTTVARAALRRFRIAGGIDAEVNLAIHRTPGDAASELASQLAAGLTAPEAARSALRRFAGTLTLARRDLDDDASAILELVDGPLGDGRDPARVLVNAGRHARRSLAVFLDEAHVIGSWPPADQEALGDADWRSELAKRFARLGVPILPAALDLLLESSGGHPYRTMLLARESAIAAISGAGQGGRCSETHIRAGLLVARRDEAWNELT